MDPCSRHHDSHAAGTYRSCLGAYCDHCLVYSFGRSKPPFCIDCALRAAGARVDPEHSEVTS